METSTAIVCADTPPATPEAALAPLSPSDVIRQVALIQEVMSAVMHEDEHYGKIPGCGPKPTLLKSGAEKLMLTFRLAPRFIHERIDSPDGHREIISTCQLVSIASGQIIAEGTGSCSTMESKYRYRTGPVEFTGEPVPAGYWDKRKEDPRGAQALLGGRGRSVKKNPDTGAWEIVVAGEKADNPDIADTYNTVLKMADKRALVAATLLGTGASDIFTQDVEDLDVTAAESTPIVETVDTTTLAHIRKLRDELGVTPNTYADQLAVYGVSVDTALPRESALRLIASYEKEAARRAEARQGSKSEPQGASVPDEAESGPSYDEGGY